MCCTSTCNILGGYSENQNIYLIVKYVFRRTFQGEKCDAYY